MSCLCFTANTAGSTISMSVAGTPKLSQNFTYSTDKLSWSTFTPGTTTITLSNAGDKVYFKGNNPNGISDMYGWYKFVMTGSIAVSGNIMSLIDNGACTTTTIPNAGCFRYLFQNCTSLTTAPELPATTLTQECYEGMFSYCSSLTTPPALPATNVGYQGTYATMFSGCTSLTTAPSLPATTLGVSCYNQMFRGCTSLTTAPTLPATTLAASCYYMMFQNCTSLTIPPALPATTLTQACYYQMFYGCTSIRLSSRSTSVYTYQYRIPTSGTGTEATNWNRMMFSGTGGTFAGNPSINTTYYYSVPTITITTQPQSQAITNTSSIVAFNIVASSNIGSTLSYQWQQSTDNSTWTNISGATSTSYTPTISAIGIKYYRVVVNDTDGLTATSNVAELHYISATRPITFSSTTTFDLTAGSGSKYWNGYLYRGYYENSTLKWAIWNGEQISATYNGTSFVILLTGYNNEIITYINSGIWILSGNDIYCSGNIEALLDDATEHPTMYEYAFYELFKGCTALKSAPTLGATTLSNYCYADMFYECTGLTTAPSLPATSVATGCYQNMFYGCSALTSAPALPATTLTTYCYKNMFTNCTSLTAVPSLPATTLGYGCYSNMFEGCTGLFVIPPLYALEITNDAYNAMFRGCTGLKLSTTQTSEYIVPYQIPYSGTGTLYSGGVTNMFTNTGGTFTGTPTINTTYYTTTCIIVTTQPTSQVVTDPTAVVAKTVSAYSTIGTLTYQWQMSTNNSTWTDISGATSNTYTPTAILGTRYYRCKLYIENIETKYTSSCYLSYYNEDFDLLVRDRTQSDVDYVDTLRNKIMNGTALTTEITEWNNGLKGAYNYTDLNRVGKMLNYLQYLCPSGTIVYPYALKWDWDNTGIPTATQISNLLANVQTVKTAYPSTTVTVPTAIDLYTDANKIEQLLYEIKDLV